jgi:ketopantoate reductase
MRGAFGDIAAAGASQLASDMFAACCAIAAKNGFNPGETAVKRSIGMLTAAGSPIAASMLRDVERGAAIEANHIVGDLLARGGARENDYPLLQIAYAICGLMKRGAGARKLPRRRVRLELVPASNYMPAGTLFSRGGGP